MTEIKLNTYIEWTAEDRKVGECPVPDNADVTILFKDGTFERGNDASSWYWFGNTPLPIIGYIVHSLPPEPIVRYLIVGGNYDGVLYMTEESAKIYVQNGRIIKLVEAYDEAE